MRTACKCRAYPDPAQASVLNRTFGCVRVVWNRTLAWRQQRYQADKTGTTYAQASAYLTAMKATEELAWLNEVSSVPLVVPDARRIGDTARRPFQARPSFLVPVARLRPDDEVAAAPRVADQEV
jgi:transposase